MLKEAFHKIFHNTPEHSAMSDLNKGNEPRQETSPRVKYKSSPQEVVLESRDFEIEGELLGGLIGDARFVKIRDDGGGCFQTSYRI